MGVSGKAWNSIVQSLIMSKGNLYDYLLKMPTHKEPDIDWPLTLNNKYNLKKNQIHTFSQMFDFEMFSAMFSFWDGPCFRKE